MDEKVTEIKEEAKIESLRETEGKEHLLRHYNSNPFPFQMCESNCFITVPLSSISASINSTMTLHIFWFST